MALEGNHKPRVLVFAGSTREGSHNRKLAREMAAALERQGTNVTLADLRDYPMPFYNGDSETAEGLPETAKAFKRLVRAHDALAIATPEYNGAYPGLLKNAIDWVSRPETGDPALSAFKGKKAAILAASPGSRGGVRGLQHLRELLEVLHVETIPLQVAVARAEEAFDADGRLVRPEDREAVDRLAQGLARSLTTTPAASA